MPSVRTGRIRRVPHVFSTAEWVTTEKSPLNPVTCKIDIVFRDFQSTECLYYLNSPFFLVLVVLADTGARMTLSQLHAYLRGLFQPGESRSGPSLRRLRITRLEDRRVFNASLALTGVQLIGGENLTISAGGQADLGGGSAVETLRLQVTEGTWSIDGGVADSLYELQDADQTLLVDASLFLNNAQTGNSLLIAGSEAQSDQVTINTQSLPIPAGGIIFVGGEDALQTDQDTLKIEGYSIDLDNDSLTPDVLVVHKGPEDGRVELSGLGTIHFQQLEPLLLAGTAEDLRIELPSGDDATVVLSDNADSGDSMTRLDAAGFEQTDFRNPTGSLTIADSSGVKQLSVRGLDTAFSADLELEDTDQDNSVLFEQRETSTGGGSLSVEADTITFSKGVQTVGGSLFLSADHSISSLDAADLTTSPLSNSGMSGGVIHVDLQGSGTASFLGGLITSGADSAVDHGGDGGNVTVLSSGGAITVSLIRTSGGQNTGGSHFGGDAGEILLQSPIGAQIRLAGDIAAAGGAGGTAGAGGLMTFDGAVVLDKSVSLTTGPAGGAIDFLQTLNSATAGPKDLDLEAGSGDIDFRAAAGQDSALGVVTIRSAANV
ncbi:MAG: hypothetical protein RL215_485, partial [Planctomycetota bacterium]